MAAPAIGKRRRWTPPVTAKVDWSHPLAVGLVAYHLPIPGLGAIDIAHGYNLALSGNPAPAVNQFGRGMDGSTNAGASLTIGTTHALSLQPPLTIMFVGSFTALPAFSSTIYGCNATANDLPPYLDYALTTDGTPGEFSLRGNSAGTFYFVAGPQWVDPTVTPIVGVITPAVTTLYTFLTSSPSVLTATGVSSISYGAGANFVFNVYPGQSRPTNCIANCGAVWNRGLSAGEVQRVATDPFQMLRW